MFGLIPRDDKFFDLFNQQTAVIVKGAEQLKEMLDDFSDPIGSQRRIKDTEHEADNLTHDIIKKLNKSFVTPLDREDIYALANGLDDILDLIDACSQRLVMYNVEKPTPQAKELAFLILKCCQSLQKAVALLGGRHEPIAAYCVEISALEHEADRVLRESVSWLFDNEKDPIQLIKWKEIYEMLEKATDKCEDAANILEGVVVKNA